jgi:uncharacterized membrane protein YdjX (TVP38/TMEM64 family)
MLGWLEDIWHGILDLPYVLIGLLVDLLNAIIIAIAALATLLLSLLPGFPDPPEAPGGVMGALLWVVPLGPILSFFALMVTCWIAFLAIKIGLRWVKAL